MLFPCFRKRLYELKTEEHKNFKMRHFSVFWFAHRFSLSRSHFPEVEGALPEQLPRSGGRRRLWARGRALHQRLRSPPPGDQLVGAPANLTTCQDIHPSCFWKNAVYFNHFSSVVSRQKKTWFLMYEHSSLFFSNLVSSWSCEGICFWWIVARFCEINQLAKIHG